MSQRKDPQRQRLYKAERDVFTHLPGRVLRSDPNATLGQYKFGASLKRHEVQELQDKIWLSKRVRARFDLDVRFGGQRKRITHRVTHGRGGAYSEGGRITYKSERALLDWIVVHEMAHEVVPRHVWHGWEFCDAYLYLVRMFIGEEAAEALKASFKRHKVAFTKPRAKRVAKPATPAQLAARAAFAERARAKAETKRQANCEAWIEAQVTFYLNDAKRWNVPMSEAEARAKAWRYVPSNLL